MKRLCGILSGILCGLIQPVIFIWIYLHYFYQGDAAFVESVKNLWGSSLFGNLLILSLIPDLILIFIFYKRDNFQFGSGIILGMFPFLILSIFMFN